MHLLAPCFPGLQRTGKGGPGMELAFVSLGRSQGAASLGAQLPALLPLHAALLA